MVSSTAVETASRLRAELAREPTNEMPRDMKHLLHLLQSIDDPFVTKHTASTILENLRDNPLWFNGEDASVLVQAARRMAYEPDERGFVSFGHVSRQELRQQCQYASRYVYGDTDHPNLGEGLRFRDYEVGRNNWHALRIHLEDISEFIQRYRKYRE